MKIYTRTGDTGETGLFGGPRVRKDVLRVEAYGTADECNSAIGVARAAGPDPMLDAVLAEVQNQLFVVGADLASPNDSPYIPRVSATMTAFLEEQIDAMETELAPLQQFILPGGTTVAAYLHLARTICRRAERVVVSLAAEEAINPELLPYLNRLSDFLFVAARIANARAGVDDVPWRKP
ncbi:cob(I)yrinic acid a,c-diamide adenosyltransferase [Chloroflexus aggregans]|jgi:cob(I)alamin adenosyltransferase|uniref:Corrinoid adenosyltransferase n=1 Tax=Chloroflexus aggregans (strain MD-66 / DSM 9485) TaxID=326427 RepID=B8GCX2_CHLAD|nr:cob(I)yrinic acid a,c-diamide adenosyltransferase [Chloroflexus aggregans]ACL23172.1 ATP/cobalamin adenosyltransferase [Chloroflexus aggregans DSM 9485]RMD76292.1 MAG: cob(I)yrinic acid a,c-diamide adenosyltransferase [Chloroflexota bacterium]